MWHESSTKFKEQSLAEFRDIFDNNPPFTVFVVSSNCNMLFMTHYLFVPYGQFCYMKYNNIIHLIYVNRKYHLNSFIKLRSPESYIRYIEPIFAIPCYWKRTTNKLYCCSNHMFCFLWPSLIINLLVSDLVYKILRCLNSSQILPCLSEQTFDSIISFATRFTTIYNLLFINKRYYIVLSVILSKCYQVVKW